jgi:hypothetical protein
MAASLSFGLRQYEALIRPGNMFGWRKAWYSCAKYRGTGLSGFVPIACDQLVRIEQVARQSDGGQHKLQVKTLKPGRLALYIRALERQRARNERVINCRLSFLLQRITLLIALGYFASPVAPALNLD